MLTRLFALALLLPVAALAQSKTTTAAKVAAGSITIDGNLDEYYWTSDAVGETNKIDQSQVVYGTIDGDADCYAQFKTLWSDNGIYVGTWYYDDIHNAMNSQYLDAANTMWDDDGLEYWFDYDFNDAWNSTATSNPQYFLQLMKGFGNLDPAIQYGGWWGGDDGSGKGWSTGLCDKVTQEAMGWREVFTSEDGLNYTCELLVEWSGSIMHQQTGMAQGGAIALDMKVNDNDGGFAADGSMYWSGVSQQTSYGLHFCKVILGSAAGMRATTTGIVSLNSSSVKYVSDIFGRRIAMNKQSIGNRILLAPTSQHGKTLQKIVLR